VEVAGSLLSHAGRSVLAPRRRPPNRERGTARSAPTSTAISGAGVGYFFGSEGSGLRRVSELAGGLIAAMVLYGSSDTNMFSENGLAASIVRGLPTLPWCSSGSVRLATTSGAHSR
jgi:hypothetical protein